MSSNGTLKIKVLAIERFRSREAKIHLHPSCQDTAMDGEFFSQDG